MKNDPLHLRLLSVLMAAAGIACLLLMTGCANIPSGQFKDWTHDGNYGVFTTHYEAHNAVKQQDGTIRVDSYTGSIKVVGGYGPSDTVTGLVIDPATKPESVQVLPAK